MKQLMPFLILSTVTFFLAGGVIVVGMKVAPTMFGAEAGPDSTAVAAADSLADSLRVTPADSLTAEGAYPDAKEEIARLKAENDSLRSMLTTRTTTASLSVQKTTTAIDTTKVSDAAIDSKGAAKMIESMTPESAAKVLVQLSPDDAKKVIRGVKARQAGKILALLPPERAAHLMR